MKLSLIGRFTAAAVLIIPLLAFGAMQGGLIFTGGGYFVNDAGNTLYQLESTGDQFCGEGDTVDGFRTCYDFGDPTAERVITAPDASGYFPVFETAGVKDVSIVFEGATADAFETTLSVVDPTADQTASIPDMGASYAIFGSLLTTNAVDVVNSVWGVSNGLRFEGATADAFELTVSPTDVGADVTATIPGGADAAFAFMPSTLTTNDVAAANSVWGASNGIVFEGATADAFETTITPTDPTADRTFTLPDASLTFGDYTVTCTAIAVADQLDQSCFIADRAYEVVRIDQVHTTAESAGTLGIMPRKQEGTEAPASGQALLSAGFDGTATAETVQNGSLTGTGADLVLAAGDRLGLDFTGDTAGELAGVVVTFTLRVQ